MFWLGTAFEHHTVGGYVLENASEQVFLMTQTEQPYWMPAATESQALRITNTAQSRVYGGFFGAGGFFSPKPANNGNGILTQNTTDVSLLNVFSFASQNVLQSDGRTVQGDGPMAELPALVADLNISTPG